MRRISLVVLVALAPLLAPALSSAAAHVTYVSPDCQRLHVRPESILFACGDGNYYASHLTWDRWEVKRAVGEGLFHQDDCRPNCADGTFHNRRGRIVLHGRVPCPGLHEKMFRRASVTYRRPLLGRSETSFRLLPPTRC